ncbi:MAG: Chorismate dehydratase [Candidatus Omnitrophica bacterium]|nr:Chorismate dehydratase [Candidatus Omnitrophota bacterium]
MIPAVRLGSISFINSLPVDLGILSGVVASRGIHLRQDLPTALNTAILAGDLDVSPVSAFWYAAHRDRLTLLPDLAIGSESGVHSVLLFSRQPLNKLAGRKIAITGAGRTTPALLEVICRGRYGYRPNFVAAPERRELPPRGADAILLIGDEALLARHALKDSSLAVTDLAAEWRQWTGLPAVFAVWAARRDFAEKHPELLREVESVLLRSREWGAAHLEEVLSVAVRKTGLPEEVVAAYFKVLRYDLGEDLKAGLGLFLEKCDGYGLFNAKEAKGRTERGRTTVEVPA